MTNELSFKELYEVSIKATLPIEVGGRCIEAGETIASFDKIQIANFQEIKNVVSAKGGYGNQSLITWDSTKEVKLSFTQGIFSKIQLALMTNSKLIANCGEQVVSINAREQHESDENGKVVLKHLPKEPVFIYDQETGLKMDRPLISGNTFYLPEKFKNIVVDYWYDYSSGFTTLAAGQQLTTGYLSLTGRIKVKDDVTGKVTTGIIKIPKLRLMSDLSMRVGSDAIPQVGRLDAVAVPEGARGQSKVMEIIFLNDDIDADM